MMGVGRQQGSNPRIALYSHDTMGLGHFRRNLLLAQAFAGPPLHASVLMLSGMREAGRFALPDRVDLLTLPAWRKAADGGYAPRSLDGPASDLAALRGAVIGAALDRFQPDLFIVDNAPRGAQGELAPALAKLRRAGRVRCVLGLRDVLDDPALLRRQWWRTRCYEAAGAWFDAVWVYGDPRICRADEEYAFGPDLAPRVRHLGYLDPRGRFALTAVVPPIDGPYVLCAAGGGQDGAPLSEAFAAARMPEGRRGVVLLGTLAPAEAAAKVRALAARNPAIEVIDQTSEGMALMAGAERIVCMGGYNTVVEALALGKPALVAPRVTPRREQAIRAARLAAFGLVDLLPPECLGPDAISAWLARPVAPASNPLAFDGLANAVDEAATLLRMPGSQPADRALPIHHVA